MLPQTGVTQKIVIPSTGDVQQWKTVQTATIPIEKGKQILKIIFPKGGYHLKDIRFEQAE
jgi:hypothetical protein